MMTLQQPNSLKAPYLSAMDIERIAYQTMKSFDQTLLNQPQQLNVDVFAEQFLRLKLDFIDLSNNSSILGMMVFSDSSIPVFDSEQNTPKIIQAKAGTALIDKSLLEDRLPNRTRFTIAHECAHWLIHKPKGKTQPLVCRIVGQSDQRDWLEWQADKLASALLMPAVAVHAFMKQHVKENRQSMEFMFQMFGESYVVSKRDQLIRIAAYKFGVSRTTAKLRLMRLKYIKPDLPKREKDSPFVHSINEYLAKYCGQSSESPFVT